MKWFLPGFRVVALVPVLLLGCDGLLGSGVSRGLIRPLPVLVVPAISSLPGWCILHSSPLGCCGWKGPCSIGQTRPFRDRPLYGGRRLSVVGLRRCLPALGTTPHRCISMFFFYPPAWPGRFTLQRCLRAPNRRALHPVFGIRASSRNGLSVLTSVKIHSAQAPKLGCLFPRWRLSQRTDWNGGGLPSLGIPADTCLLLRPPGGVAAVSERPRCGPISPSGILFPGM